MIINTVVSLFESGKKPCLRLSNVAKNNGEIIVFPHLNALWIITVIHSAYLFFFFMFFFYFSFFFPTFSFFFFFFHFFFLFFFTKWCGEITVSPHPNTLWITTVIHCAFLFFFFQTFPFPFFRFFLFIFFSTSLFFHFFSFFP